METVPVRKVFVDLLTSFTTRCYKLILGINKDVELSEKDLANMLQVDSIEDIWRKRRMNAYSHIARLPYKNPARITLFGKMVYHSHGHKRRFFNVKRTMMKDLKKCLNEATYCNLCDRRMKSVILHNTNTK